MSKIERRKDIELLDESLSAVVAALTAVESSNIRKISIRAAHLSKVLEDFRNVFQKWTFREQRRIEKNEISDAMIDAAAKVIDFPIYPLIVEYCQNKGYNVEETAQEFKHSGRWNQAREKAKEALEAALKVAE